ncbi:ParB N-terminal domain-containing protein [Priestia megaterium]|uniref:ParB N-terminal domain-containing protein n=1 Tax=Priestia megaterium TaxID=1404 RepID=UPI003D07FA37
MYGLVKVAADQVEAKGMQTKVYNYLKKNYPPDCLQWVKDVEWKLSDSVPLSDIKMARRPGGAREQDKVKGIAQAIRDGQKMEPVVLVRLPNGDIKIADGYHRTKGYEKAEKKNVRAYIATVKDAKGPWDKEMHEKKLNVGKAASFDGGLAKIAFLHK